MYNVCVCLCVCGVGILSVCVFVRGVFVVGFVCEYVCVRFLQILYVCLCLFVVWYVCNMCWICVCVFEVDVCLLCVVFV